MNTEKLKQKLIDDVEVIRLLKVAQKFGTKVYFDSEISWNCSSYLPESNNIQIGLLRKRLIDGSIGISYEKISDADLYLKVIFVLAHEIAHLFTEKYHSNDANETKLPIELNTHKVAIELLSKEFLSKNLKAYLEFSYEEINTYVNSYLNELKAKDRAQELSKQKGFTV
jgi:hypothetical protein